MQKEWYRTHATHNVKIKDIALSLKTGKGWMKTPQPRFD